MFLRVGLFKPPDDRARHRGRLGIDEVGLERLDLLDIAGKTGSVVLHVAKDEVRIDAICRQVIAKAVIRTRPGAMHDHVDGEGIGLGSRGRHGQDGERQQKHS